MEPDPGPGFVQDKKERIFFPENKLALLRAQIAIKTLIKDFQA